MTGPANRAMAVADPLIRRQLAERLAAMTSHEEAAELLNGFTLPELRTLAGAWGVDIGTRSRKPEIVDAIARDTIGGRPEAAAGTGSSDAPGTAPHKSDEPLMGNTWGGLPEPGKANVHPDGEIPLAVRRMGDDAHLDVDGRALGNLLLELATDGVAGRVTAGEQVYRFRQLRDKVPAGSRARRNMDLALDRLDAPPAQVPDLPDSTPAPLRRLVEDVMDVPGVRGNPERLARVTGIAEDFAAGRTGGLRLVSEVRNLAFLMHESQEGAFQVRDAVAVAVGELRAMHQADRTSLRPPAPRPEPEPELEPELPGELAERQAGGLAWTPDGTGVQPNGDIGGDGQVGDSYSVRYKLPASPDALVTVSYYAENLSAHRSVDVPSGDGMVRAEQPPPEYAVTVQTELMVCDDPDDPGGTERWSDYRQETFPERYPTAEAATSAAVRMAHRDQPSDIDWAGQPPGEPATSTPTRSEGTTVTAVTYETAKAFLVNVTDLAAAFALAGERGCADLARAGLPQPDLAYAASIADTAGRTSIAAGEAFTGLVGRHEPAQQAYYAAGGAPYQTGWHGL